MASMKTTSGALLAVVMAMAALATAAMAKEYTVGGSDPGWDTYVDYNKWTDGKTFMVGDVLSFKFEPYHNVVEVTAAEYAACTATKALATYSNGSATFELTDAGTRYFICSVPLHCLNGTMHVKVTTVPYSAALAAAASPAPSSSTPADVVPTNTASMAPAAAPSSAASAPRHLQPAVAVAGLALAALVAMVA